MACRGRIRPGAKVNVAAVPAMVVVLATLAPSRAHADADEFLMLRHYALSEQVVGLSFSPTRVPIEGDNVTLHGFYPRVGWKLAVQSKPLVISAGGKFSLRVPATAHATKYFTIVATGPVQQTEKSTYMLTDEDGIKVEEPPIVAPPFRHFKVGMGLLGIGYQDLAQSTYFASWVSAQFEYRHPLNQLWSIGGAAEAALLPMTKNRDPVVEPMSATVFADYSTDWISAPWLLTLRGAGRLSILYSNHVHVGFDATFGPEATLTAGRLFRSGLELGIDAKFWFALTTGSGMEWSGGVFASHPLTASTQLTFELAYTNLTFGLEVPVLQSQTYQIRAIYGF